MTPLILLTAAVLAAAEAPQADELLRQTRAWLAPARSSTRKLEMTVRSGPGGVAEWKAGQARGTVGASRFVLTVLLAPADVRGTALLVEEQQGKPTAQWLYVPSLRRVRRLPLDAHASFLHTDFTVADMGFFGVQDRKVSLLGTEPLNGRDAYKLQELPDDQRTFKRIVTWVATDTKQPLKREYYDAADKLWLVETFEDVAAIHDVPTAQRVRMEDVQSSTGSEYRVRELAYDVPIPKELFDQQQLSKAADHPIW